MHIGIAKRRETSVLDKINLQGEFFAFSIHVAKCRETSVLIPKDKINLQGKFLVLFIH